MNLNLKYEYEAASAATDTHQNEYFCHSTSVLSECHSTVREEFQHCSSTTSSNSPISIEELSTDARRAYWGLACRLQNESLEHQPSGVSSSSSPSPSFDTSSRLLEDIDDLMQFYPSIGSVVDKDGASLLTLVWLLCERCPIGAFLKTVKSLIQSNPNTLLWKQGKCQTSTTLWKIFEGMNVSNRDKETFEYLFFWIAKRFPFIVVDIKFEGYDAQLFCCHDRKLSIPFQFFLLQKFLGGDINASTIIKFYELFPQSLAQDCQHVYPLGYLLRGSGTTMSNPQEFYKVLQSIIRLAPQIVAKTYKVSHSKCHHGPLEFACNQLVKALNDDAGARLYRVKGAFKTCLLLIEAYPPAVSMRIVRNPPNLCDEIPLDLFSFGNFRHPEIRQVVVAMTKAVYPGRLPGRFFDSIPYLQRLRAKVSAEAQYANKCVQLRRIQIMLNKSGLKDDCDSSCFEASSAAKLRRRVYSFWLPKYLMAYEKKVHAFQSAYATLSLQDK